MYLPDKRGSMTTILHHINEICYNNNTNSQYDTFPTRLFIQLIAMCRTVRCPPNVLTRTVNHSFTPMLVQYT